MKGNASVVIRFSRSAGTYSQGVALHEAVGDELLAGLPWPARALVGSILDVGCGTGVLTMRLRQEYPGASITAIDAAEGMVHVVRKRMARDSAFRAAQADARTYDGGPFDLATSSSALHWMTPLAETAAGLRGVVKAGGSLRVALMVDGTLGELHDIRRRLFPSVLPVSRLLQAAEVVSVLQGAGWRIEHTREQTFRSRYASAADFLRVIHAQGLTGGGVSHGRRLLTRGELVRLTEAYGQACREPDGGVWASYRVLFVAAAG